jgi:hypothetical protein
MRSIGAIAKHGQTMGISTENCSQKIRSIPHILSFPLQYSECIGATQFSTRRFVPHAAHLRGIVKGADFSYDRCLMRRALGRAFSGAFRSIPR